MSSCNQKGDILNLTDRITTLCHKHLTFLDGKLNDGHYNGRSFYGETFTALAMTMFDYEAYKTSISGILQWYNSAPKLANNFHWEFNNYALLKIKESHEELSEYVHSPLPYRGTKCTNWTLLRLLGKYMEGINTAEQKSAAETLIKNRQLENGLVLDEQHVASFQYHCFIMSLIYDFYQYTDMPFFLEAFLKGVDFISKFTLNNGDTLYVGRGQEQIFGYGNLIYIYIIAFDITKNIKYIDLATRVLSFIEKHWSEERMLPLVLNEYERDSELTLPLTDRRHLGWYSYNNYYDYLPFCTYYFVATANILRKNAALTKYNGKKNKFWVAKYYDDCFFRYSNEVWDVALSVHKGASANAIPFPFIIKNGYEITSVCGGDDYVNVGYYQLETIPLPSGRYKHTYWHMVDSKQYLKKKLRSIIRHNADYANVYLWEQGELHIFYDEISGKFGIHGGGYDFRFRREINIIDNTLRIKDFICFKRNVRFSTLIPFKLFFTEIKEIGGNQYKIPNGILTILGSITPIISRKKYMTAKSEMCSIEIYLENYCARKNEEIVFEYTIGD